MAIFIIIPLLIYITLSLNGYLIGQIGSVYLIIGFFSLIMGINAALLTNIVNNNETYYVNFGIWFKFDVLCVEWELVFDILSITILFIVSFISFCVHLYSIAYIWQDAHFIRFISLLSLFTFFIIVLITAANLLQFFIGWEGIGLCSYLLINFWGTRLQANKAAIKAIIVNKIGDLGYLVALSLIVVSYNTLDFSIINSLSVILYESNLINNNTSNLAYGLLNENDYTYTSFSNYDFISLIFFIAICAKSAQFGLHTWLPSAMEGPTPVSALIHAATIVTAGIFLILRLATFFSLSGLVIKLFIIIGFVTALTSAVTAIFIYDIKRIIAYSTCSQLGYIVMACGFGEFSVGYFHLLNHAFFKAPLFLTAGILIHSRHNEQDIRLLGVGYSMPIVTFIFSVSSVALIGLPFFSGFFSKEHLLLLSLIGINSKAPMLILIGLPTIFTTLYSLRVYHYLFTKNNVIDEPVQQSYYINIVLSVLFWISVIAGFFCNELLSSPIVNFLFWELNTHINTISIYDVQNINEFNSKLSVYDSNAGLEVYKDDIRINPWSDNARKDIVAGDCTDRGFIVEARGSEQNTSWLSSSSINQYFGYNQIKFILNTDSSESYIADYTSTYDILLNYYHVNFTYYCNRIIQAYFPLKSFNYSNNQNIDYTCNTVSSQDWNSIFFSINTELAPPIFNQNEVRFTSFHLLVVLFYHIKFDVNFFEGPGEQEFYSFLLSPFFNRNTGFGDAVYYYKGIKAAFENYDILKHPTNKLVIPAYLYYSEMWKMGVITGGYHLGAPLWVVWLVKIYYSKIYSALLPIQNFDMLNINFLNSSLYSIYYLYILFNNHVIMDFSKTIYFVEYWTTIIGSKFYFYAINRVNEWFESFEKRSYYSVIIPAGTEEQIPYVIKLGWTLQSPLMELLFQNIRNDKIIYKKETDWDYGYVSGLPEIFNYYFLNLSSWKSTYFFLEYFNYDINKSLLETLCKNNYSFNTYCNESSASVITDNVVRHSSIMPNSLELLGPFELISKIEYEYNNSTKEYNVIVRLFIESAIPLLWRDIGSSSIESLYNTTKSVFNSTELFDFVFINYAIYVIFTLIICYYHYVNNSQIYYDYLLYCVKLISTQRLSIVITKLLPAFFSLKTALSKNFLVDNLYNYFTNGIFAAAKNTYKYLDKGVLEWFGPINLDYFFNKYAQIVRQIFSEKMPVKVHLIIFLFNCFIIVAILVIVYFFI